MHISILGLRRLFRVVRHDYEDGPEYHPNAEVEIVCRKDDGQLFIIHLYESFGMCGSGYTTASWGHSAMRTCREVGPLTHTSINPIDAEFDEYYLKNDEFILVDQTGQKICTVSSDGDDSYYPRGRYEINWSLFKETGRGHSKPLIHVFMGKSNLGKSSLGMGHNAYETDCGEMFGNSMLVAEVIVIGNKYGHTFDQVRSFFSDRQLDVEFVPVQFGLEQASIPMIGLPLFALNCTWDDANTATTLAVGHSKVELLAMANEYDRRQLERLNKVEIERWREGLIDDGLPRDVVMATRVPVRLFKFSLAPHSYSVSEIDYVRS